MSAHKATKTSNRYLGSRYAFNVLWELFLIILVSTCSTLGQVHRLFKERTRRKETVPWLSPTTTIARSSACSARTLLNLTRLTGRSKQWQIWHRDLPLCDPANTSPITGGGGGNRRRRGWVLAMRHIAEIQINLEGTKLYQGIMKH